MNLLLLQYSECSLSFLIGYSRQLNHWEKLGKTQSAKRFELSPIRLETILVTEYSRQATTGLSKLYTDQFNGGKTPMYMRKTALIQNSVMKPG
jgi:hypothetical protein